MTHKLRRLVASDGIYEISPVDEGANLIEAVWKCRKGKPNMIVSTNPDESATMADLQKNLTPERLAILKQASDILESLAPKAEEKPIEKASVKPDATSSDADAGDADSTAMLAEIEKSIIAPLHKKYEDNVAKLEKSIGDIESRFEALTALTERVEKMAGDLKTLNDVSEKIEEVKKALSGAIAPPAAPLESASKSTPDNRGVWAKPTRPAV